MRETSQAKHNIKAESKQEAIETIRLGDQNATYVSVLNSKIVSIEQYEFNNQRWHHIDHW